MQGVDTDLEVLKVSLRENCDAESIIMGRVESVFKETIDKMVKVKVPSKFRLSQPCKPLDPAC